ncbi:hypothetical protein A9Q99_14665 [Gammaproteobacteria bacterium 45_16_T64]|nr:hypothetical protein A9Q99_14665 [Gammaproteobacteria bacterium 45_16_T64]
MPFVSFAEQPAVIGQVVFLRGEVQVLRADAPVIVKRRDRLFEGDHVSTGKGSRFSAKLLDGSVLTLGESSDLAIKEYQFDAVSSRGSALFRVTKGAFRVLTGEIQQMSQHRYQVETPVATIGVRGTDFWGGFIFGDQLDVTVLSGKVFTQPSMGTTVTNSTAGAPPSDAKMWPQSKLDQAIASVSLD